MDFFSATVPPFRAGRRVDLACEGPNDFDNRLHDVPVSVANAQVMVVPCQIDSGGQGRPPTAAHLVIARKDCPGERVRGQVLRRLVRELAQARGASGVTIDIDGAAYRFS